MYAYETTPDFEDAYFKLDDDQANQIDQRLKEILSDPGSVRGHSGRLRGDGSTPFDQAWIYRCFVSGVPYHIYWDFLDEKTIYLLCLIRDP